MRWIALAADSGQKNYALSTVALPSAGMAKLQKMKQSHRRWQAGPPAVDDILESATQMRLGPPVAEEDTGTDAGHGHVKAKQRGFDGTQLFHLVRTRPWPVTYLHEPAANALPDC